MRYLKSHLPMALWYGVSVFLLRGVSFPLSWGMLAWVWWIVGVGVGVMLLFIDRLVYVYSYPNEQLSQTALYHWRERDYAKVLGILDARRSEQNKLTFRSALFIAIWVPLSFFALTSTASLFGKGVVMGIMLHILSDAWRLQRKDPARLNERLFWQIARPVTREQQVVFLWLVTLLFVFFSWWVG